MLVKQSYRFLSQYLRLLLALLSPSYLLVQGGDQKRGKSVFGAFFIYETLEERLSSINSSYNVFTAEKKKLARNVLYKLSQPAPRVVLLFALGQLYFT